MAQTKDELRAPLPSKEAELFDAMQTALREQAHAFNELRKAQKAVRAAQAAIAAAAQRGLPL